MDSRLCGNDVRIGARAFGVDAVEEASVWGQRQRALTFGLVLIVSLTAFEAMAVATVLPAAIGDIGGVRFYGWAFSSFMLSNLVGIQMAGQAADRRGAHPPFIVGCLFFALGLIVAGLSRGPMSFIVGRLLQGAGAGAVSAAAYVAVARGYATEARPRMLAIFATAWVIPGMIGPAAAGALAHLFGWRSVFLFLIPLVAVALLLAAPALRKLGVASEGETPSEVGVGPALALAVGVGLALLSVEVSFRPAGWSMLVAGVLLAFVSLRRLLPSGTLRAAPGLPAAIASLAVMSAAFFGAEAYVPLAITTVREQSTFMAGATLTAATLCWTTGTWIQERWVTRIGHRPLAAFGLVLMIVGIAGTAMVLWPAVSVMVAPITWGVAGLGMGIAYPTASLVALSSASPGREGEASAALQLANVLGMAIGTGIGGGVFGFVTAEAYSTASAIAVVEGCAAAAAVLGLAVTTRLASVRAS